MNQTVSASEIRRAWITRREIALIDLREEAAYAQGHPLFAASLPLSRLELEIFDRIPRRDTPIVLYDDGEGLTERATECLGRLGYADLATLENGLDGWREAGFELFRDVNSASKAFGELVEARRHTPFVTAPELRRLIDAQADLVVLDARRFEEYRTMNIPTGISVPGAELVLRARELAPDPKTTIVVNCAGRTRSIIGAQSLINAGVPNPVRALRNGTIGWTLAGDVLDHGQARDVPEVDSRRTEIAAAQAREVAYRAGVKRVDMAEVDCLLRDTVRTLYRFDVRTPAEYQRGHIPGFRSAPGGQLVQETDVFAPVRGARIILADDVGPRADMTASWLAQMGWEAYVLDGGFAGVLAAGVWSPSLPEPPLADFVDAPVLAAELRTGNIALLDLASSPDYRRGHIGGAKFVVRSRLSEAMRALAPDAAVVLTSQDAVAATFASAEAASLTGRSVRVLAGGTQAWARAGLPLELGLAAGSPQPDDVYRRPYEGTDNPVEAMEAYLEWEYGLVDQLRRDGSHGFYVI